MIHARPVRAAWLASALLLASGPLAMVGGCGPAAGGGPGTTVKDPPPLPKEETTEELMRQKAKTGPRPPARPSQRR
jgi:hypothetical protein